MNMYVFDIKVCVCVCVLRERVRGFDGGWTSMQARVQFVEIEA